MDHDETGIAGLDIITYGGLPAHSVTAVLGPPGAGKSVLMMQTASRALHLGRHVVLLAVYSEPVEKLIAHMRGFRWFDPSSVGSRLEMLTLRSTIRGGGDETMAALRDLLIQRKSERPLLLIDGYRGMRNALGPQATQEVIASLSSLMLYTDASAILSVETGPLPSDELTELAAVDAIVELSMTRSGADLWRSIEVRKLRGSPFRAGRHAFTVTDDGVSVFPRLATVLPDREPALTERRLGFGLPELDAMMDGGLPEYSVSLLAGPGGCGKTTLGMHWLLDGVRQGQQGLLVSFRESVADLGAKAAGLGLPEFRAAIDAGTIHVMRVPPTEINPDVVAHELTQSVASTMATRCVLDGLTELEFATARAGYQHDYLGALVEYLWRAQVTLLLLRDSTQPAVGVAQNRIELRRVLHEGRFHRVLGIVSMQASWHDTTLREFEIGDHGIHILRVPESEDGLLEEASHDEPYNAP